MANRNSELADAAVAMLNGIGTFSGEAITVERKFKTDTELVDLDLEVFVVSRMNTSIKKNRRPGKDGREKHYVFDLVVLRKLTDASDLAECDAGIDFVEAVQEALEDNEKLTLAAGGECQLLEIDNILFMPEDIVGESQLTSFISCRYIYQAA